MKKITQFFGKISSVKLIHIFYNLFSCWLAYFILLLQDPEIICWDIRYPGNQLFVMYRYVQTNQRMYFDIDW